MLIVVGVLFIVIENRHKGRKPQITKISQMGVPVLIWIGVFQMLAMIPGTSRSGATIVGALALGVSRTAAADFTFFLAIPAMAGASLVKLRHFGFDFTETELGLLLLWMCCFHLLCPFWRSSFIKITFRIMILRHLDIIVSYLELLCSCISGFMHCLHKNELYTKNIRIKMIIYA